VIAAANPLLLFIISNKFTFEKILKIFDLIVLKFKSKLTSQSQSQLKRKTNAKANANGKNKSKVKVTASFHQGAVSV
jgi:hypothetical protein